MKTSKSHLILIVLLLGSLAGNSVYAQYAPGTKLPEVGDARDYDWQSGQKGFLRFIGDNESISIDKRIYSIWAGTRDNGERFRVSANGTTSILGAFNGKPALNFYTANNFYLGSIGFPNDELTITGLYGIRINPYNRNKIFITENETSIFNPVHLSLVGYYADEGISFKMGRNQEPLVVSSFSGKRLRIGSKSGIGFWGDGNVGMNNVPNLSVKADGSVSVSNALTLKLGWNSAPTIKSETAGKWLKLGGAAGIAFWGNDKVETAEPPHVVIAENKMTIGQVTSSANTLNVGGTIYAEKDGVKTFFGRDTDYDDAWIGTTSNHGLYLGVNSRSCMYIDADYKNVYVGLVESSVEKIRKELREKYSLFVAGGVLSEDYSIGPKNTWSDFVFSAGYNLKPIEQVEDFIIENKHLPDVPSAKQVAEEGYSQHDMNKVLLQKIEELTLYTIQQQKEIQELKTQLNKKKK